MKKILFILCISIQQLFAQDFIAHRNKANLIDWNFKKAVLPKGFKTNINETNWSSIKVPHTYSMDATTNIGYYKGDAWYRKKVTFDHTIQQKRTFIRFEGVGRNCQLYVNEKKIGEHNGSYSAFCFEITDNIKIGDNLLTIKVNNEIDYKTIPVNDKLFNSYGGIYRPVAIFQTPKTNISPLHYGSSGVFIHTEEIIKDNAHIKVKTHISNKSKSNKSEILYTVLDTDNNVVVKDNKTITIDDKSIAEIDLYVKSPILWNAKKNPYLYTLRVELKNNGTSDIVTQQFGIRQYKVDPDKGFILNNEPYRLYGVSRHQEWQNEGPALTDEHHQKDISLINEMGATALRLAHYQQADIVYTEADRTGLLVWAEIPYVNTWSGREDGNALSQLKELILQNYNHPSIFVWGLYNEVRAYKESTPAVRTTKRLNELAHKLDPHRLTTSASDRKEKSPMTFISDLQAWNKYFGWYYGAYNDMGKWLDETHKFYPNGGIGLSEYGVGANIEHQDRTKLEKPSGNYFPEQEQTYYHEVTWPQLKSRPFVWGTFIWNMFDFSVNVWNRGGKNHLNHKGLVSYDRKIKKDAFYFYKANWSKEPTVYITEKRNTERNKAITDIKIYSNLKNVILYVNGEKVSQKTPNENKIVIFKKIKLKKGSNQIDVIASTGNKKITHHVDWNLIE